MRPLLCLLWVLGCVGGRVIRPPEDAAVTPSDAPDDASLLDGPPLDAPLGNDTPDAVTPLDVPRGWTVCTDDAGVRIAVNTANDSNHCGGCGVRCCRRGCSGGQCNRTAPAGWITCDDTPEENRERGCIGFIAVDPTVDENNCGMCRLRCATGEFCLVGRCTQRPVDPPPDASTPVDAGRPLDLPPGSIVCDDSEGRPHAIDPTTDSFHCGGCNQRCAANQQCVSGQCQP